MTEDIIIDSIKMFRINRVPLIHPWLPHWSLSLAVLDLSYSHPSLDGSVLQLLRGEMPAGNLSHLSQLRLPLRTFDVATNRPNNSPLDWTFDFDEYLDDRRKYFRQLIKPSRIRRIAVGWGSMEIDWDKDQLIERNAQLKLDLYPFQGSLNQLAIYVTLQDYFNDNGDVNVENWNQTESAGEEQITTEPTTSQFQITSEPTEDLSEIHDESDAKPIHPKSNFFVNLLTTAKRLFVGPKSRVAADQY